MHLNRIPKRLAAGLLIAAAVHMPAIATGETADLAQAKAVAAKAAERTSRWSGPTTGPAAPAGKTIALVAEDLRNGGVVGFAQGVREAAGRIGWKVKVFDAGGTPAGRSSALSQALKSAPDGLVFAGADALENRAELERFRASSIPVVAWHAGEQSGPIAGTPVAMNLTTDALEVARTTALAAIAESGGRAGVVIFTDSNFRIAMAKAEAMASVIRACAGCTLLEVHDLAISEAGKRTAPAMRELLQRHGSRWTHALAINDIYFDYAIPALIGSTRPLRLLSAGDGSASAFQRIQAHTFQTATVAEPLTLQGWQAVDELNRLIAGQPVSGFVPPVHLVTPDNVAFDGGPKLRYDPDNGYRDAYLRIWKR
jgi:ribose transport system substrate-binding protein